MTSAGRRRRLRRGLEALRRRYDARYLFSDPLELPRRFAEPDDREIVALLAAALAYGNVGAIRRSIEAVLAELGPHPARAVRGADPRALARRLASLRHRWNDGRDVACLLYYARQMIEDAGSLGGFFRRCYVEAGGSLEGALDSFSRRALELDSAGLYGEGPRLAADAGVRFFFPSPARGSACKRLNMLLRWMVRPDDGVDLGLWPFVPLDRLVVPLDTHLFRIGRHLGWTKRKTPGWAAAVDVTRALARVAPEDPVRYDFALSRMGILEGCPRHPRDGRCELCALRRAARPSRRAA